MDYHKYNTMNKSLMLQTATEHKAFTHMCSCHTTVKATRHTSTQPQGLSKLPLKSADGELLDAIQGKAFYEDQKGPSHWGGFPWDRLQKTQGKDSQPRSHTPGFRGFRTPCISAKGCAFFSQGMGPQAFIKFTKVSVNLKKVEEHPQKRQHWFQNFCQGCGEKREPFYTFVRM